MKWVALIAVVCLQLATLACGVDAFVHQMDDGRGAAIAAGHQPSPSPQQGAGHTCEVHAAHVFADIVRTPAIIRMRAAVEWPPAAPMPFHLILEPIDHPPIG